MERVLPAARVAGGVTGLRAADVPARRAEFGANHIVESPRRPWLDLLVDTVRDPMIWFLVGTGLVYLALGSARDAVTLLLAIVPLVGMDAFLHRRTRASTEGLQSRLAARATVVRDGVEQQIPAGDVVAGDLVIVGTGESFPADGVLVGGDNLQADESTLTGEAFPVRKAPLDALPDGRPETAVGADRWGFAGTRLLTGRARMVIVFTGAETLFGEIVRLAAAGRHARTPLQAAIGSLVTMLLAAALVLCAVLSFVRLRQGFGWVDALVSAATLAVAALPEEFPVVFTVFLGVGVYRLAKRQALVRRAVCVENIGRVSCICSDKTGTITEGRLAVRHVMPAPEVTEARLLAIAALASRRESGDPLDLAIVEFAAERGAAAGADQVVEVFPFTESRRRETVIARVDGGLVAAMKGASEEVLSRCGLTGEERTAWERRIVEFADGGHKVIACAWRPLEEGYAGGEPDRGYRFAGLAACEDPVRDGVKDAVGRCRDAGIHVLMITGDHPRTALAVAREIGLGGAEPRIVTGEDLGGGKSFLDVDVVARAMPAQKLAIVRSLQAQGQVVAVTGDGVNDVPALQAADIGIAMGGRGTRSAREVSAIILLDDNFRSIVDAMAEGRQLFRNLQLSFLYLFLIHIPLVLTATMVPLAGYPLLFLPIHIVWLETLIHPTAMLVFQELAPGRTLEGPRPGRGTSFFAARDWVLIVVVGVLLTLFVMIGYDRSLGAARDIEHARAMAMVTLTVSSAAMTAGLSRLRTRTAWIVAAASVGPSLVLVQTPFFARALHLAPLHLDDWGVAVGGGLAAVLLPVMAWSWRR